MHMNTGLISLFIIFMVTNWVLFTKLQSSNEDNELMKIKPGNFKRLTIHELIANMSVPLQAYEKIPERDDIDHNERLQFIFHKIECGKKPLVTGKWNRFRICYPPTLDTLAILKKDEPTGLAYFINGQRDNEFEKNFKAIANRTVLKVFTRQYGDGNFSFKPDLVEDVDVKIYIEENNDKNGQPVIGIKDLIDSHDDYHKMEFIKYEMKDRTPTKQTFQNLWMDVKGRIDPIVFSINIPIFASHLLLRLEDFTYREFRYLIKRLAYALYLPYAVINDKDQGTLYVSMMHKYSMHKYITKGIEKVIWKESSHQRNNYDEL